MLLYKSTIRDRGSTAYTVDIVYTVDKVYTVDMVCTVDSVYNIETALHC